MLMNHCLHACSWLREQHAIAGAINALFAPSLETRIRKMVINPLFTQGATSTPNQSVRGERAGPLLSSTPHHGLENDEESFEHQPVDIVIKNPLFGSGLQLQKVHSAVIPLYINIL